MMTKHIYVHIPFCDSICFYCDFFRLIASEPVKQAWLKQIIKEIKKRERKEIETLYFGGGTPSSLSIEAIEEIANCFLPFLSDDYEWTIEANPDSIDLNTLKAYKKLGINRISLGVQSFQDDILKAIGRKHSAVQAKQAITWIKALGFNCSIDLMYGLPNQSLEDVKNDLEEFLSFDLDHLSIYSLQIEEHSVFGKRGMEAIDEDLEADMYEWINKILSSHAYEHYEISSYAKNQKYSRHNCSYWNDSDFIGFGCGASGREHGVRYDIDANLKNYCENGPFKHTISLTLKEQAFEAIMMALRTQFGLSISQWNQKYHRNFEKDYRKVLKKYKDVLILDQDHLYCNEKGLEILNAILVDFLD